MKAVFQQLQSDLCVAVATEQSPHRPSLPKLDILAVDADEETQVEWEQEDDVKGGPLNPVEVKIARQKEIQYLWDREVYEYATEAQARARTGRNPVGLNWIDTNKGSAEEPRYRSRLVFMEVRPRRSSRSSQQHTLWKLCESCSVSRVRKTSLVWKIPS